MKNTTLFLLLPLFISLVMLNGCGGGGGSNSNSGGNGGSSGPTWTAGIFKDESTFKNMCQVPRSGTDPYSGNAYPDKQGSTIYENHWLRSWSNNTYLWYDEIADINPAQYADTLSYFDLLKTNATTPSGTPKDQFHFTYTTEEWQQLSQSGVSFGYGVRWKIIAASPPREIRVAYNEPNSPAILANLGRGAEIIELDGVDAINAGSQASVDALNAALFPSAEGETHTFTVRDLGSNVNRTFTMTSASITSDPVPKVSTIDTSLGKVGYILFNSHIQTAEAGLIDAVNQLKSAGITDLVLDLRYNGGGYLDIASQLAYMIAGPTATSGKIFESLTFNNKHQTTNPVTGQSLTPTPFHNTSLGFSVTSGQALPTLNLNRLFILSTASTCSASEAIINGLNGINLEIILIGDTTCGKPYGFYATDNCAITYFTVQFRGENDQGFGDYSDGFSPMNTAGTVGELVSGCSVLDDFLNTLGDPLEGQLAAALLYRETGSCPTPATIATSQLKNKKSDNSGSLFNSAYYQRHIFLTEHRILKPPQQ